MNLLLRAGLAVVAALAAVVLEASPGTLQAQRSAIVTMDTYDTPPSTLADMWAAADLVVRARVIRSEQRASPGLRHASPVVRHEARIVEAFKALGSRRSPDDLIIAQPGGVVVSGGQQVAVDDKVFPVLQTGQEAIFFLMYWSSESAYAVAWGPGGALMVSGRVVTIPSSASKVLEFRGRRTVPVDELARLLRSLK